MWHGCTIIDPQYPIRSGTNDGMAYLMGLLTSVGANGFTTLKAELSVAYATKYPYNPWGTPATLTQLLQETTMANAIATASIRRVQFNTFSLAHPLDNPWAGTWTTAIGNTIETEFYDACVHLRNTYHGANKEFILQNWEGDWQLLNVFDPKAAVPLTRLAAYRDWNRRRQRAMRKAIADTPGKDTVLRYAIECNRVRDRYSFRVVSDVLKNVQPDVVSLSIYEAIEGWTAEGGGITQQAAFETDIGAKLIDIVGRVREYLPTTPIVFGEYGFPQLAPYFTPFGFDIGALHQKIITVGDSLGVEGEIFWQLCDNEEYAPGSPVGFCIFNRNGNASTVGGLTASGDFYEALL